MGRDEFTKVFLEAVEIIRKKAPKDTGNLAYHSIKYHWLNDHQFEIYVDVGDTDAFVESREYKQGEAPYMPFTNEKWTSPRWNGKPNPNENWWNDAVEEVVRYIAKRLKGKLE